MENGLLEILRDTIRRVEVMSSDLAKERAEHAATRERLHERIERLSVDYENAVDEIERLKSTSGR